MSGHGYVEAPICAREDCDNPAVGGNYAGIYCRSHTPPGQALVVMDAPVDANGRRIAPNRANAEAVRRAEAARERVLTLRQLQQDMRRSDSHTVAVTIRAILEILMNDAQEAFGE